MQELLEAGMHFGHLTRRWNPKMKPYIYGVRNGIHIIDLSKTVRQFQGALDFLRESVGRGADILFVGTKRQAQDIIRDEAVRCNMFYINRRWLGGTLTNFRTIKASIDRLKDLQKKKADGTFSVLSKKELLMVDREIEKLLYSLGGIQEMKKLPGIMVMIDPNLEHIALHEANVLNIPIIALADTNCDPDMIDHLVAGNDDALRSIRLFLNKIADEALEGLKIRELNVRRESEERKKKEDTKPSVREVEVGGEKRGAYVARLQESEGVEEAAAGQYSAKVEVAPPESAEDEDVGETSLGSESGE
jgi:small subunit ribosomal protein S2